MKSKMQIQSVLASKKIEEKFIIDSKMLTKTPNQGNTESRSSQGDGDIAFTAIAL